MGLATPGSRMRMAEGRFINESLTTVCGWFSSALRRRIPKLTISRAVPVPRGEDRLSVTAMAVHPTGSLVGMHDRQSFFVTTGLLIV